jgi:hypothetical protein
MSYPDLRPTPGGRFIINPFDRIEWKDRKEQRIMIVCDEDAIQLRDLLNEAYPVQRFPRADREN